MAGSSNAENTNVFPVWALMPDECRLIRAHAEELISSGCALKIWESKKRAYACVFDIHGAPFTIMRVGRFLHLLDRSGGLLTISEDLGGIWEELDAVLLDVRSAFVESPD